MVRFVHLMSAAYWLGGLVMLAMVVVVGIRVLEREALRTLLVPLARTFSWGAVVAGLLLAGTGYLLASRRLSGVEALSSTSYGRRLALKLLLVVLTLAATALHVALGRSTSRHLLIASRSLAVVAFLLTAGVFYVAAQLVSG
jgi:putative copper export protein